MNNDITVEEAFNTMINYFNTSINKLKNINPFAAAQLTDNRDALILHGDPSLRFNELFFANK